MLHARDSDCAYPTETKEEGISVWQAYKMAALQGFLANPNYDAPPEDTIRAAEMHADAAVAGDQARNEGGE